ncbi:hypothetical protein KC19_6G196400 [Ceratodon purpureus]|uniref:Cytochrome P450 n=2 Tax=Ceratodon purpureus TaxID=3225 RepID=A0A8T0HJD6_CERPU|nr:hypothetical protein KC19_6G196400 [Ceratodon purpureus]
MLGEVIAAVFAAGLLGWLILGRSRSSRKGRLPPGSLGWPIVGETLQFLHYSSKNNWTQFYKDRVAKYGEAPFRTNLFLSPTVIMPAPEGNKFLFQNENKAVVAGAESFPPSIKMLLGPDCMSNVVGEEHKRLRRLCGNFFTPEGIRRFVPQMCKIAKDHFMQHWEGRDEIFLGEMTKQFAFEVACFLFISMEAGPTLDGMNTAFTQVHGGLFSILPYQIPGTSFYKAMKGRKHIDQVSDAVIARRRQEIQGAEPRANQDLLDVLLTTPDEEGNYMSDDAIKDNLVNFLFAGHDTSAHTLAMIARMLHHNPYCLEGIVKEQREIGKARLDDDEPLTWEEIRSMKYTWAVIQETMRIEPVVLGGFRTAIQDVEFGGYTIPKGWKFLFSTAASHRSEKFFPNPDKFDPSRFEGQSAPPPYTYVPFGGGPRLCLGYEFARLEMLIFLHYVTLNYEFEMVEPDEKIIRAPSFPKFEKGMHLGIRRRQVA